MKIFVYALRNYDEGAFLEQYSKELGFEYAATSDYPSLENLELARGFDAIAIITNVITREMYDKMHELGIKYIATRSIGVDHLDLEYIHKLGMRASHVTYSPNSVANYTIMMMLMACRNMQFIIDKARLQDFSLRGKIGKELSLCTVGVIGTGQIGATLIRHLSGFGCKILAYDLYEKEELKAFADYVDLDTLYAQSDIVTLHVPGMKENYHMINEESIAKMKDGAIFVNAARGMLVDTEALISALESGKLSYAALDTFEEEFGMYYINHEGKNLAIRQLSILSSMPNVLLSPHMAFYTDQAVSDMVGNAVKGLLAFEKDEPNPFEV